MHAQTSFWDALAPHHAALEDNYLDLASLRRILKQVRSPVLVVGAGQGLLVAELRLKGFRCDGVDFSSEMIRYANRRRGLELIQAEASAMPLGDATYATVVYATGVIDFNSDENSILAILSEGRRVLEPGGRIFVAFYRLSPALEDFVKRLGLLNDHVLQHRQSLESYVLTPVQMVRWTMKKARTSWLGATALICRLAVFGTLREKMTSLKMQRIMPRMENPQTLIEAAPQTLPYRNETEIRKLFARIDIPIQEFRSLATCWIALV